MEHQKRPVDRMSLRHCSLHGRLFSFTQQRWMPFPQEKINEIKGYYELLCSTNADSSYLKVIETACDQCEETVRQIFWIKGNKGRPPRRQP